MHPHDLANITGYLGSALGVSMVIPQIVRTLRDRSLPGVSALSWALTALGCTCWMLYGFRTGELPQIPGNVLLVSGAVVIVLAVPSRTSAVARGVGLAGAAAVLCALAVVVPPSVLGVVALGGALVSSLPQTVRSLRSRGQQGASAVSLPSWVLRVASQLCWLAYAVVLHDIVVTISAAFILSSALVLIASELSRRPVPAPAPVMAIA
jgi:uncharacterized protein with PQ loop repeat